MELFIPSGTRFGFGGLLLEKETTHLQLKPSAPTPRTKRKTTSENGPLLYLWLQKSVSVMVKDMFMVMFMILGYVYGYGNGYVHRSI